MCWAMTILSSILFPILISAYPDFDDPDLRGAPFESASNHIPETYLGGWAETRSACRSQTLGQGKIEIEPTRINGAAFQSLLVYSDYPAIIVRWPDGANGNRGGAIHFDISYNEMWLKVRNEGSEAARLFRRCPTNATVDRASSLLRKRVATSCASGDRDGFLDAFFTYPAAQQGRLFKRISIIRGDAPAKPWPRRYYRMPPIKFAPHASSYELTPQHYVPLAMRIVENPDRAFVIDWEEDTRYTENAQLSGMRGRLTFKWVGSCWKLASDEIRWTDWP